MARWLMGTTVVLFTSCMASQALDRPGDRYGPSEGDVSVSVGGTVSSTTTDPDSGGGGSTTTNRYDGQLGVGLLVNDWFEVGGQLVGGVLDPEGGQEVVNLGAFPYVRGNLRVGQQLWLYLGPHAGYLYFDGAGIDGEGALSVGGHGGAKLWFAPNAALFIEPRYTYTTLDNVGGVDLNVHEIQAIVGLSISF